MRNVAERTVTGLVPVVAWGAVQATDSRDATGACWSDIQHLSVRIIPVLLGQIVVSAPLAVAGMGVCRCWLCRISGRPNKYSLRTRSGSTPLPRRPICPHRDAAPCHLRRVRSRPDQRAHARGDGGCEGTGQGEGRPTEAVAETATGAGANARDRREHHQRPRRAVRAHSARRSTAPSTAQTDRRAGPAGASDCRRSSTGHCVLDPAFPGARSGTSRSSGVLLDRMVHRVGPPSVTAGLGDDRCRRPAHSMRSYRATTIEWTSGTRVQMHRARCIGC